MGCGVILKETTPFTIKRFHSRIKMISQRSFCTDLQWHFLLRRWVMPRHISKINTFPHSIPELSFFFVPFVSCLSVIWKWMLYMWIYLHSPWKGGPDIQTHTFLWCRLLLLTLCKAMDVSFTLETGNQTTSHALHTWYTVHLCTAPLTYSGVNTIEYLRKS